MVRTFYPVLCTLAALLSFLLSTTSASPLVAPNNSNETNVSSVVAVEPTSNTTEPGSATAEERKEEVEEEEEEVEEEEEEEERNSCPNCCERPENFTGCSTGSSVVADHVNAFGLSSGSIATDWSTCALPSLPMAKYVSLLYTSSDQS